MYSSVLACFQTHDFDSILFLHRLMGAPRHSSCLSVHDALGAIGDSCTRRPVPTQTLGLLTRAKASGQDINSILDSVVDSRAGPAVTESTARTYHSHLNQIRAACELLGVTVCPATILTIRRASAIVNNPSTLRGWLSAWRQLHILARVLWVGDSDPHLYAARAGLTRQIGPAPARGRMRKHRLKQVLQKTVSVVRPRSPTH